MPNYVYNTITFYSDEDAEKVYNLVKTNRNDFDFNAIIPMPATLSIASGSTTSDAKALLRGDPVPDHYKEEGEAPDPSYFYTPTEIWGPPSPETLPELRVYAELVRSNEEKYGFTDWYDWSCHYWGTKWNACCTEWRGLDVSFETAWAEPEPIFLALAEKLNISFKVACEEESLAWCSVTEYTPDGVSFREEEEGYKGLVLLGYDKADIIERYEDWCDEGEMRKLESELDELGIV